MKFHSTQFGTQEVDPESILTFPKGMPGFESSTRYKLFHADQDQPVVHWLQSIDEPDVAFALVDPATFSINYEFTLTDEEERLLQMEKVEDIAVLLIAYKPQPDASSSANISANINGPIVLNVRARTGMQKVLVGLEADITLKSKKPAA
ncbi:MAG: flagellar assembly protein FliW [Gammaproteobacteria bacterium]|nr:flagellar assembly protein FliW [Gammaproteobacteria bacterium]